MSPVDAYRRARQGRLLFSKTESAQVAQVMILVLVGKRVGYDVAAIVVLSMWRTRPPCRYEQI